MSPPNNRNFAEQKPAINLSDRAVRGERTCSMRGYEQAVAYNLAGRSAKSAEPTACDSCVGDSLIHPCRRGEAFHIWLWSSWHTRLMDYALYRGATTGEASDWASEELGLSGPRTAADTDVSNAYVALVTLRALGIDATPGAIDDTITGLLGLGASVEPERTDHDR